MTTDSRKKMNCWEEEDFGGVNGEWELDQAIKT